MAARHPDSCTSGCAGLAGATPELLIRKNGPEVSALVLAGTKPRGATAAEDSRRAVELIRELESIVAGSDPAAELPETYVKFRQYRPPWSMAGYRNLSVLV